MPSKKPSTTKLVKKGKKPTKQGFVTKVVSIPGKEPFVAQVKETKGIDGCYSQWGPNAKPTKQHPTRGFKPAMLKSCTEACR